MRDAERVPEGPYPAYDVRKIVEAWKYPSSDLISICAHRGAAHDGGTENSFSSIARAAKLGIESIEIDLRLTKDGKIVLCHDDGLGRLTDVAPPDGQKTYNPFTGKGYNPLVKDKTWEELKKLNLRNAYGEVTNARLILLQEALDFIKEREINIVCHFDLKERDVIGPSFELIQHHVNAAGQPAAGWCVYMLRVDWIPNPADWEAQPFVRNAISQGKPLPRITPFYEVAVGDMGSRAPLPPDLILNMAKWAEAEYFVGYEIALERPGSRFQPVVDFVHSDKSKLKGHGAWFRGSLIPREYFKGEKTVWDDSEWREKLLALGPDAACSFYEGKGISKPGGVALDQPTADLRNNLQFSVDLGVSYIIADTETDIHGDLARLGKRNVSRMLRDVASP